jgi:hypothetical protein
MTLLNELLDYPDVPRAWHMSSVARTHGETFVRSSRSPRRPFRKTQRQAPMIRPIVVSVTVM